MLGGEQSGHIEAIGFEMYTTMLEEAVSRLKGEGREERPQVTVNLGISLRIDDTYIPEEGQRLRMYKRIAGAESMSALTEVRAELEDRYGKPPDSVLHLLIAGEIRLTCEMLGIAQIERKRTLIEEPKKAAPAPAAARPNVQRRASAVGRQLSRSARRWQDVTGRLPRRPICSSPRAPRRRGL
jgi:transcription-repair coupling factor (superfamily II helicase)